MKTTTLQFRKSRNRWPLRHGLFLSAFVLACFALAAQALAVCQEGCDLSLENTFLGDDALISNTTGVGNTAIGFKALLSDTSGYGNTAIGWSALYSNTTGTANTASGVGALQFNTTGFFNTATGDQALQFNTTGGDNTAIGFEALGSNTTGSANTAIGESALGFNTTGNYNTAIGNGALDSNTTGSFNTAFGFDALLFNTRGGNNIAVGFGAGIDVTSGSHNIDIGNHGRRGESNTIRIGAVERQTTTFIAGISGATVPTGVAVIVDGSGHLGTTTSSARFKEAIKPMDKASEAILALKPVTFRYKHELDPNRIPQFGLVAEDVEKVNPDLVARDKQGKPYSVRYEAVNAMLLNEFLKEHRKVEQLEKQIAALTAGLQKVSAQLELNKTAPQTVLNSQ
jgi:trimeric autotransporter adhesin